VAECPCVSFETRCRLAAVAICDGPRGSQILQQIASIRVGVMVRTGAVAYITSESRPRRDLSTGHLKQEFVVGGFRGTGADGVDALIVGYYENKHLRFSGEVRAGMVPHVRRELFKKLAPLHAAKCPFVNLPDAKRSRWGGGCDGR
jgi:hypothetical protein